MMQRSKILLLLFLLPALLAAQRKSSTEREPGAPVAFETHNFISREIGMSRLDVHLGIPERTFVFVRNPAGNDSLRYSARAEISIEVLNGKGEAVGRKLTREEFRTADPPDPSRTGKVLQRMYSFDLPPAKYSIALQVNDLESSRRYTDDHHSVVLRDFRKQPLEISDLLFMDRTPAGDNREISPVSSGGDIPIGHNFEAYSEITTTLPSESLRVSYDLFKSKSDDAEKHLVAHDTVKAEGLSSGKAITLLQTEHGFSYRLTDSSLKDCRACWMHIRADTLPEGRYELRINSAAGTAVKTATQQFRIRWLDMPLSLRDLEVAIKALEYIASEDEFRNLKSADHEKQRILFDEFWKRRDTTSKTAYSPLMAEYYRRVDYAMSNFSTLRQTNGFKTDRGKAYILYGPPTSIQRDLKPNSVPQEIWEYDHLHKKLTFIDESKQGNYKLYSTGTL